MRINRFFAFQTRAIAALHRESALAHQYYAMSQTPQVVSFTAPTGAGKTIMMATLMENIYMGTEQIPAQPDAIFVWLSDSPELNQQSRDKIDLKSDKIQLSQCVTIQEDSFDREVLEEGHIYFLNTQKLGRSSNLVHHSDSRQYTIWETLKNTVEEKADLLYVIIDEAHRGAKTNQTTIMQKFVKGSQLDGLPPMPVVIGMSATNERFDKLVAHTTSTRHPVIVTPEEVRESGLLKDKIIITYPESCSTDEMAVLEAAADQWKHKCEHWKHYCDVNHREMIRPILLLQVMNGSGDQLSATDLDLCLEKIEQRTGYKFEEGEVVHTFGQTTSTQELNGLPVPYVEPSRIAEDRRIRVVMFKENLSTGWDCPRAEAMMSFRRAADATYIAQLLGRMVRTPLGMRVQNDESLNDVHLYLPYFNRDTVQKVVDELQNVEGGALPTDIEHESMENGALQLLGCGGNLRTRVPRRIVDNDQQLTIPFTFNYEDTPEDTGYQEVRDREETNTAVITVPEQDEPIQDAPAKGVPVIRPTQPTKTRQLTIEYDYADIPRIDIIRHINKMALSSYHIRNVQITDYLTSLYAMCRFLSQTNLNDKINLNVYNDILNMIHAYGEDLRQHCRYEAMKQDVLSFKLHSHVFDVFGHSYAQRERYETSSTESNLYLQLRQADHILGQEGMDNKYIRRFGRELSGLDCKIDVILFSLDENCKKQLDVYAKQRFFDLNDQYRRCIVSLDEALQKRYMDIIKNGSAVSEVNFVLPETIAIKKHETSETGDAYGNHLYVDEATGLAHISLNGWEKDVIREEAKRSDFICWLRNTSRSNNSLCLKYNKNGVDSAFYPDFLIIRKDATSGYVVDILEPHNPSFDDNVAKAKALADYAKKYQMHLGRVQLIRRMGNSGEMRRLDMGKTLVRESVLNIQTSGELDHLFETSSTDCFYTPTSVNHTTNEKVIENHYHIDGPYIENQIIKSEK